MAQGFDSVDDVLKQGFELCPDGVWRKPSKARCLVSPKIEQPDSSHERLGKNQREVAYEGRCLVRVTSFRRRLLDEGNAWTKHFVDALVEADILRDDSPAFVKLETIQKQVAYAFEERTEIEIEAE